MRFLAFDKINIPEFQPLPWSVELQGFELLVEFLNFLASLRLRQALNVKEQIHLLLYCFKASFNYL